VKGTRVKLQRHPDCPPGRVIGMEAEVLRPSPAKLDLRFLVTGALDDVVLPEVTTPQRADGLWQHTCFEAFIAAMPGGYYEFNLSPSTDWAAYRFSGYRADMSAARVPPPRVAMQRRADRLELTAFLNLSDELGSYANLPWRVGLSAVIEDRNGRKSYWALAHAPGKPDFHHGDCFALDLPPAA
jgi:hypothetical protein